VLACLYNPGRTKKVPEKMQKVTRIFVEISFRVRVPSPYATHIQSESR
jgi:hypothetical protein